MPASVPEPFERATFDAATLVREHPPVLRNTNKLVVYRVACPEGCVHGGTIGYTRWHAMSLPDRIDPAHARTRVVELPTIFDYVPLADVPGGFEWHVNFADPMLFFAYGSGLFAQDEMQTAEHPALGALVHALQEAGHRGMTEDESGPTPVLVTGVERRVEVAIDRNEAEGRPRGLYGDSFAAATPEVVRRASRAIEPPTISNLIALAAPSYGVGDYSALDIEHILVTAYTGFSAAVAESARVAPGAPVVVHTGYWGCGVFGGNRQMMSLLQLLAAGMAGVEHLAFHTVRADGAEDFRKAQRIIQNKLAPAGEGTPTELIARIEELGLTWGMGNGQ